MLKNTERKKKKKLRKLMLSSSSSTITQNHLVNIAEEEAKKKRLQSNAFLPDELIAKIISVLSIKTIFQLKCVSKSWNSLISDPTFVEKHLSKSSQNSHVLLTLPTRESHLRKSSQNTLDSVVSLSACRLLENQSCTVDVVDTCKRLPWLHTVDVVGTCKGLLCLLFYFCQKYWFRLWNPATRKISEELGTFEENNALLGNYKFSFGFDISTGTYKVVAYRVEPDEESEGSWKSQVRLFHTSDKCWRDIESFPLIPVRCIQKIKGINNGVHLSGTVNWLTLSNYHHSFYGYKDITSVEQFVIVSLDLSTETYTQFLLPSGFDKVPHTQPTLEVLLDCLCFSHDFKRTEFVIWQMKEFGVQESWTQLFRIDYFILQMNILPQIINMAIADMELLEDIYDCDIPILPLYLSKDGDTLILANYEDDKAIIYNRRDKSVKRIIISQKLCWLSSMNYVESLVSPPWKTRIQFSIEDSQIAKIIGDSSSDHRQTKRS